MSQLRCYTCLQLDRKLRPLEAQVKFIFALLCPEMFIKTKDTARYLICWECEFMADKIKRFQTRIKKANEILNLSFKGKTTIIEGLSCLKVTAVETISLTVPQNLPMLPQNLPMLPQNEQKLPLNVPMLPKIEPRVPENILELSLKDMLAIPIKMDTQAEVKIEEDEESTYSNDFDELIQSTTILQVPIEESDPLLIPRLNQPAEIEVPAQKAIKVEITETAINYIPQKVFIETPKDEVELSGFREAVKVLEEDPYLVMSTEINPVLVNKNTAPVKSKRNDSLLSKLLSAPSKSEELFLKRQRVLNLNPTKVTECQDKSGANQQRVPNTNPTNESECNEQCSGVASAENEAKLIILTRTELNALRDKKRLKPAYLATSLKCEPCIAWFNSQEKWDEHNLKHDMLRGNSVCEICEQRFADDSLRSEHYNQHFILYECRKCPSRYTSRVQLSIHCLRNHEESTFLCKKCRAVFKTFKERSLHILETHNQRRSCEECGKTFPSAHLLRTHVLNTHKSTPVQCRICKKIVKKRSLKIHMKLHDEKSEDGAYCADCGTTYKSKYIYEQHLKNSLKHNTIEKLGLKCDHCEKYFANKASLKNHTEEIGGVKYTCDICNKERYGNSINLICFNHRPKGTQQYTNRSVCYWLGPDSKTKRILARHIQTVHEGKKPKKKLLVCEVCGKSFKVKKSLREHLNSHLGIRPHVCKDCGATFTYSAALFTHRRLKHKVNRKF